MKIARGPTSPSLWAAGLVAIALPLSAIRADEAGDDAKGTRLLEFRRVHVPSDRLSEVPLGVGRYVPMSAREFEEGVSRLTRPAAGSAGRGLPTALPTADVARYDVSLSAAEMTGTVSFDVGAFAANELPWNVAKELPLGDIDVRSGTMRTASGTGEAVIFGRQGGSLAIATPQPGTYTFVFRRPLTAAIAAGSRVHLPLVPALSSTVALRLPRGLRPVVVGGNALVFPAFDGADGGGDAANANDVWRIETGPRAALDLLLVPRDAAEQRVAAWTTASIRGREVSITVRVRPSTPWLPVPLRLRKDADVVVTRVALGTEADGSPLDEASWRVVDEGRGLLVDLPGRCMGGQQPLLISAVAPLESRGGRLPLVRVEDATWVGGGIEIGIAPAWSLASIDLENAMVVPPEVASRWPLPVPQPERRGTANQPAAVERMAAPDGMVGEVEDGVVPARVFVEEESPHAAVTLSLAPRAAALDVARVTSVDLSPGIVVGRAACDVRVLRGEAFDLSARITPGWFVDSVEATGPPVPGEPGEQARRRDAIDGGSGLDWKVQRDARGDVLRIGLTAAATPARGLGLRITGHRGGIALGDDFQATTLDMVRFDGESERSTLVEFRTSPDMTVEFDGGEQPMVPADGRFAPLAEEGGVRARMRAGHRSASRTARLVRRRPPLDVRTQVRLTVRDDRLTESFTFECQPSGSDLDAFVVQVSEPMDTPLDWSLLPPAMGVVSARRLDASDGRPGPAALAAGGERWLVELVPPARGPVTIRGSRTTPFRRATAVPMAWVEGATTAVGHVVVRDVGRSRPQLVNRRLSELAPDSPSEAGVTTLGEFSYGAGAAGGDAELPAAELLPGGDARAWAWREITSSWCHASGLTEYETIIDVENQGRPAVSLGLPPGRRVQGVLVDGMRVPLGDRPAVGGNLRVELPVGRQFVNLVIRTVADAVRDGGLIGGTVGDLPAAWRVEPAAVDIDMPVLQREWRLLLPPGIEIALVGGGLRLVGDPESNGDWVARLLGATVKPALDGSQATPADVSLRGARGVLLMPSGNAAADSDVVVVRGQVLAIMAVLAGVVAAGAVMLAARLGSWPVLLLCLLAGVAALWCVRPVDGVARAVWWAAVGTAMLMWARGARRGGHVVTPPSAAAIIVWAVFLGAAAPALAQEAGEGETEPSLVVSIQPSEPLRVFITPADVRGKDAAGESLALVPEELFRMLVRAEDATAITPVRVLEQRIAARVAADADAGWGTWRLAIDVDADDGATLVLDQSAVGGRFPAERAWIDGVPSPCRLEAGGGLLRIALPQAGRHSVEVDLEPVIQRRGETETATISIPVSPTATLQVVGGNDVADQSGIVCERMTGRGVFSAAPASTPGPAAACDVSRSSQVRLVRSLVPGAAFAVHPKAVVSRNDIAWSLDGCRLTATFEVEPGEAIVRSFEVVADPGLELVEPQAGSPDAAETVDGVAIRGVDAGRFLVERKSPDRGRMRFEMVFRMQFDDPVGAFDVPAVWLDQAGMDLRTVRFSANPSLAVRVDLPAGLAVASIPDSEASFDIRSWREEVLHPLHAAAAHAQEPSRPVRLRPRLWVERRRQAVRGSQRLSATFAADAVRLHLDARIDASSTALVTLPLELPRECVVDRITLVEDDALHPETAERGAIDVHWTRTTETSAAVVVQRPRAGRFRLEVDARIPGRPAAAGPFPCLRAVLTAESRTLVDWQIEDGRLARLEHGVDDGGAATQDDPPTDAGHFERPATGTMPAYLLESAPPDAARRTEQDGEQRPSDPPAVEERSSPRDGRVELADVRLAVDERGRVWGMARFEILAADRTVRLRLPPSWRLFNVSVDGRPVEGVEPVLTRTDNEWEFRMLDQGWPRSVIALFAGDLGRRLVDGEPFALTPPEIVGLPCRQVIWTLDVPEWIVLRVQEPALIVTADRLDEARRAALGRLEQDFEQSIARLSGGDQQRLRRFFEARRAGGPLGSDRDSLWASSASSAGFPQAEPVTIVGDAGRLTVRAVRRPDVTTRGRALATLSLLVGCGAAWFVTRRGWPIRMPALRMWPWCSAVAGTAWLSSLTPSWPGAALLLAAAVAALDGWMRSRRPAPAPRGTPAAASGESTTRVIQRNGPA